MKETKDDTVDLHISKIAIQGVWAAIWSAFVISLGLIIFHRDFLNDIGITYPLFMLAYFTGTAGISMIIMKLFRVEEHEKENSKLDRKTQQGTIPISTGSSVSPRSHQAPKDLPDVGVIAVCDTTMRPYGMIRFLESRVEAKSDSGLLPRGSKVRVVRIEAGIPIVEIAGAQQDAAGNLR